MEKVFGKYLENAVFLAWKAKSIIKAKEKKVMFEAK
jgi:hypothetical protein